MAIEVANIDAITLIMVATDCQVAKAQLMDQDWPFETVASMISLVEPDPEVLGSTYPLSVAAATAAALVYW